MDRYDLTPVDKLPDPPPPKQPGRYEQTVIDFIESGARFARVEPGEYRTARTMLVGFQNLLIGRRANLYRNKVEVRQIGTEVYLVRKD